MRFWVLAMVSVLEATGLVAFCKPSAKSGRRLREEQEEDVELGDGRTELGPDPWTGTGGLLV